MRHESSPSPPAHPASLSPERLLAECDETRTRRKGPGGQHRNKVETAVVLVHRPTGVRAEASERRSQSENRRVAVRRLRLRLALEVRTAPSTRDADSPSALWRGRCHSERVQVAREHEDFAPLLAEALDVVHPLQGDVAEAASRLGVTSSQLVKLLRSEPAALRQVNQLRRERGLPGLK